MSAYIQLLKELPEKRGVHDEHATRVTMTVSRERFVKSNPECRFYIFGLYRQFSRFERDTRWLIASRVNFGIRYNDGK
jgi:hypothetical protein